MLKSAHSGEVVEEEGGRMESDLERIWWPGDSPVHNCALWSESSNPGKLLRDIYRSSPNRASPQSIALFRPNLRQYHCVRILSGALPGSLPYIEIPLTPVTSTASLGFVLMITKFLTNNEEPRQLQTYPC